MSTENMEQLEQQVVASVDGQLQTPVMTHTGQVKWFNNKLCYGFIRVVSDGDSNGEDIFVHQKNITPNLSEWRSLRLGEYVSFQISTEGTKQAVNVRGVNGGPLMVDELLKSRNERRDHATSNGESERQHGQGQHGQGQQGQNRRPRGNNRNNGRNRNNRPRQNRPRQTDSFDASTQPATN